jgi:hypothetical protein
MRTRQKRPAWLAENRAGDLSTIEFVPLAILGAAGPGDLGSHATRFIRTSDLATRRREWESASTRAKEGRAVCATFRLGLGAAVLTKPNRPGDGGQRLDPIASRCVDERRAESR